MELYDQSNLPPFDLTRPPANINLVRLERDRSILHFLIDNNIDDTACNTVGEMRDLAAHHGWTDPT